MFHLNAIDASEGIRVEAVSDINDSRMRNVKTACGANEVYCDYKDLLNSPDVDAVVINTPPSFHEQMVIESLEARKHILCEKPLSQTVEGCLRIKKAQNRTGLTVLPAHNYAFTPSLMRMRDFVNNGEVGEVKKVTADFENNLKLYGSKTDFRVNEGRGVVEDVLPHIFSVTSPFAGNLVDYKRLDWWCKSYKVCDNLAATFVTDMDLDVECNMSWTTIIPKFKLQIYGSEANVMTDLMISPYTVKIEKNGEKQTFKERGLGWYLDLARFRHPSFQMQYMHFKDLVEGTTEPWITVDNEIAIIRVIEKVSKKLEGENAFDE
jgi:predicted dehydrogenase